MHPHIVFKYLCVSGPLLPTLVVAAGPQYFIKLQALNSADVDYFARNNFHVVITREEQHNHNEGSGGDSNDDDDDEDSGAAPPPKERPYDLAIGFPYPELTEGQTLNHMEILPMSFVQDEVLNTNTPKSYFLKPTHAKHLPYPGKNPPKQVRVALKYRLVPGWEYHHQQTMLSIEYSSNEPQNNLARDQQGNNRLEFSSPKTDPNSLRACVLLDQHEHAHEDHHSSSSPDQSPQNSPIHQLSGSPTHQHHSGSGPAADGHGQPGFHHSGSGSVSHTTVDDELHDGKPVYILRAEGKNNPEVPSKHLWSCRAVQLVLEEIPKAWLKPPPAAGHANKNVMSEVTSIKEPVASSLELAHDSEQAAVKVPSSSSNTNSDSLDKNPSDSHTLSKHPSESAPGDKKSSGDSIGED